MFIQYIRFLKKGVSPLIATILLVVVSVILVVVVLTWGKDFVSDSLVTTTEILDTYQEADLGFYLKVFRSGNGRIIVDYFPPSNSPLQDVNLIGYGLLGYTEHVVPFEPPVLLKANKTGQIIDHGIMLDRFDLLLYTEDGYVITKKNISQEILQPSNCPEGYIPVPGNYLYGTAYPGQNGFCVMKYEAKEISGDIVSVSEVLPKVAISQINSRAACNSISFSGFDNNAHLITNDEWMTIVRNIEMVPENWYLSSKYGSETWDESDWGSSLFEVINGNYSLPRGHSSNNPPNSIAASSDDSDGYINIDNVRIQNRRTLFLTNNQIIWDLAGNVYNWIDYEIHTNNKPTGFDSDGYETIEDDWYDYSNNNSNHIQWNNLGHQSALGYKDLFLLTNPKYNAIENGIGRINLQKSETTNKGFVRGGFRSNNIDAGILLIHLGVVPSYSYGTVGFRCVVVP